MPCACPWPLVASGMHHLTQGHKVCYMCPTLATKTTERAQVIGLRVCEARDEAGLNNTSLALATGLPRRTIVRVANGRNEADTGTLERIANATGKPLDFFRVDAPPAPSDGLKVAAENLVVALMAELRSEFASEHPVAADEVLP